MNLILQFYTDIFWMRKVLKYSLSNITWYTCYVFNPLLEFYFKILTRAGVAALKMLGLYLLGQNCLHLTFEQYLGSENYSRKYEKLPNIVILECKNITEKMQLLKMSGPQIWLCLFTFRPIASKQLNGLTTIETFSWLGCAVVKHPLWVQEVLCSILISGRGFYVSFFPLLLLCFYFVVKTHYLSQKFAIPFTRLIDLVYLTYCKICDRL